MNPVAEKRSAAQPAEQRDALHYASIHLTPHDPLYYNIRPVKPHMHTREEEEEEEDSVEYTVIKPDQITVAPRWAAPPTETCLIIRTTYTQRGRSCQSNASTFVFTDIKTMETVPLHCTAQRTETMWTQDERTLHMDVQTLRNYVQLSVNNLQEKNKSVFLCVLLFSLYKLQVGIVWLNTNCHLCEVSLLQWDTLAVCLRFFSAGISCNSGQRLNCSTCYSLRYLFFMYF